MNLGRPIAFCECSAYHGASQHGSVPTSMAAAILACGGCVGHVRGTSLALRSWAEESGDRNQRQCFVNAPPPCAPPARSSRRRCRSRDNRAETRARLFLSNWNRCGGRCDSRGQRRLKKLCCATRLGADVHGRGDFGLQRECGPCPRHEPGVGPCWLAGHRPKCPDYS